LNKGNDLPRAQLRKGAEGVGFEPTVGFPTLDFESSALNRTQPPFQSVDIVGVISRCAIVRPGLNLQSQGIPPALNGDGRIGVRARVRSHRSRRLLRNRRTLHRRFGQGSA
jgi:hypothetical protein